MFYFTINDYKCHKGPLICYFSRNHYPVLVVFMTYHWISTKNNTTGVTSEAGSAYPHATPEFLPVLVKFLLFVFMLFAVVLSVLRYTAFKYPLWYLQS